MDDIVYVKFNTPFIQCKNRLFALRPSSAYLGPDFGFWGPKS